MHTAACSVAAALQLVARLAAQRTWNSAQQVYFSLLAPLFLWYTQLRKPALARLDSAPTGDTHEEKRGVRDTPSLALIQADRNAST